MDRNPRLTCKERYTAPLQRNSKQSYIYNDRITVIDFREAEHVGFLFYYLTTASDYYYRLRTTVNMQTLRGACC